MMNLDTNGYIIQEVVKHFNAKNPKEAIFCIQTV